MIALAGAAALAASRGRYWQGAAVDFGPVTSPAVTRGLIMSLVLIATGVQLALHH
jgi:hypothetical protein